MKHFSFLIFALLATTLLSACKEDEKTNTVEWYMSNNSEREAKLSACVNDPAKLAKTPNCVNAKQAELQLSSGSLRHIN